MEGEEVCFFVVFIDLEINVKIEDDYIGSGYIIMWLNEDVLYNDVII